MATTTETIDGSIEIKLNYPLNFTSTLTMRRPKVRDTLAAQRSKGNDAEKEIFLFAALCEVTKEQIEALDMLDYQQVQETYSNFLA